VNILARPVLNKNKSTPGQENTGVAFNIQPQILVWLPGLAPKQLDLGYKL